MKTLIDSTRASSLVVVPSQIGSRCIGMITTVILARYLSVGDYGTYNLFIGSLLIFRFLMGFGLGSSLQRFLAEYAKTNKIGRLFRTFFFAIEFRAISGILFFGLAIALYDYFAPFFKIDRYHIEFILFCIGSFALFQIEFLQIAFNSLFLHKYSAIGQLAYFLVRLLLIFYLLLLGGGLKEVFTCELIAYGIGCIMLWYLFTSKVYKPWKVIYTNDSERIEAKRLFRYSAYNAGVMPGGILFSHAMDFFVVAAMDNPYQLGIYALASRASKMLTEAMPQNILQTVIRPAFYHNYYSSKDKTLELNKMFRSLVVLVAAFLFPVLALFGILGEPILVNVFGAKFRESSGVFLLLLCFNVFTIFELSSDLVLQATEKVQARLYAQVFAVYNIVAAILLMSKFGIYGVAFATGSALMGKCLFYYYMAHRYSGITIPWLALMRIIGNASVACMFAFMLHSNLRATAWNLVFTLFLALIVYITMTMLNNFMNPAERKIINRFCKRQVFNV